MYPGLALREVFRGESRIRTEQSIPDTPCRSLISARGDDLSRWCVAEGDVSGSDGADLTCRRQPSAGEGIADDPRSMSDSTPGPAVTVVGVGSDVIDGQVDLVVAVDAAAIGALARRLR